MKVKLISMNELYFEYDIDSTEQGKKNFTILCNLGEKIYEKSIAVHLLTHPSHSFNSLLALIGL